MILKNFFFVLFCFPSVVFADNICSEFKYNPEINVNKIIDDKINITKSKENLEGVLGYAVLKPGYKFQDYTVIIPVKDGYCVSLRGIDIDVIYPSFDIVIDKDLKDGSCAYNYVLEHEKDHIKAGRKVLDSNLENIKENLLINVANSIEPVYISNKDDKSDVGKKITEQLQNHPDVVKFLKKVNNELDEENSKIDTRGDQYKIYKCDDFFKERKNSMNFISID